MRCRTSGQAPCHKVLIAIDALATKVRLRWLDLADAARRPAILALWKLGRMPLPVSSAGLRFADQLTPVLSRFPHLTGSRKQGFVFPVS